MNSTQKFSLAIMVVWALLAVFASSLSLQANEAELTTMFDAPSMELAGLLGYDDLGRPILARLLSGAQVSLLVAFSVTLITAISGTTIGLLSAWTGGWLDTLIVRIMDVFLAFPGILLAIALAGLLGPGINNVIIALSVTGWVGFARLARVQALSLRQREHVQAAQALGSSTGFILSRHLLPLVLAPLLVEASFAIAGTVIAEAGLSFLGLGVQAPQASWGGMLRDGVRYMLVAPHMTLAPACMIMVVVFSVNILGDYLRDRLDIRLRD